MRHGDEDWVWGRSRRAGTHGCGRSQQGARYCEQGARRQPCLRRSRCRRARSCTGRCPLRGRGWCWQACRVRGEVGQVGGENDWLRALGANHGLGVEAGRSPCASKRRISALVGSVSLPCRVGRESPSGSLGGRSRWPRFASSAAFLASSFGRAASASARAYSFQTGAGSIQLGLQRLAPGVSAGSACGSGWALASAAPALAVRVCSAN